MAIAAELFRRGLSDHRRALAGWCAGIVLYVVLLSAIFPSIEGSPQLSELLDDYPEALKALLGLNDAVDITKGAGFIDTELFSFMLPLLAIVLAISSGARTLAGEEDAGRLELVFAYPVSRRRAVTAKAAAVGVETAIFCTVAFAALVLAGAVFDLELALGNLAGGLLGVGLLALLHGCLAIATGAARPSRALAVGVPASLAAGAYLVGGLHGIAGWLDPFRFLSSFWWTGQAPLSGGVDYPRLSVVAIAAAATLAAALALIGRRDLETT